jgi:hypothetical protein
MWFEQGMLLGCLVLRLPTKLARTRKMRNRRDRQKKKKKKKRKKNTGHWKKKKERKKDWPLDHNQVSEKFGEWT